MNLCRTALLVAAFAAAPPKPAAAAASAPAPISTPVDPRALAGQCRVEAQRNAKLYALRAHGIQVLRSADRAQTRSVHSLDGVFADLRSALGRRDDLVAQVDAADDAAASLTELAVQEPVVGQIRAAEAMADRASAACAAIDRALGAADGPGARQAQAIVELQLLSQRIARVYLAAPLTRVLEPEQQAGPRADHAAFEQRLGALRAQAASDVALREHLLVVDSQWAFYRAALARPRGTRDGLEYVGRVSEYLYETFEDELARRRRRAIAVAAAPR